MNGRYNVKFPKFKMTQEINPKPLLKKLGKEQYIANIYCVGKRAIFAFGLYFILFSKRSAH